MSFDGDQYKIEADIISELGKMWKSGHRCSRVKYFWVHEWFFRVHKGRLHVKKCTFSVHKCTFCLKNCTLCTLMYILWISLFLTLTHCASGRDRVHEHERGPDYLELLGGRFFLQFSGPLSPLTDSQYRHANSQSHIFLHFDRAPDLSTRYGGDQCWRTFTGFYHKNRLIFSN